MVIYEVSLQIKKEIYDEYYQWLVPHVKEMLACQGFQTAEIGFVETPDDAEMKNIRINYLIDTYENLQNYFNEHAPRFRADGKNRFGDKFAISRRVILDPVVVEA